MDAQKAFHLETLIRQQRWWVVELGGDNAAIVDHRRTRLAELKAELGVTDEQAFIMAQARARGEIE